MQWPGLLVVLLRAVLLITAGCTVPSPANVPVPRTTALVPADEARHQVPVVRALPVPDPLLGTGATIPVTISDPVWEMAKSCGWSVGRLNESAVL